MEQEARGYFDRGDAGKQVYRDRGPAALPLKQATHLSSGSLRRSYCWWGPTHVSTAFTATAVPFQRPGEGVHGWID
jgi:hypothetical protein